MALASQKRGRYRRELTTKEAQKHGENWLRKQAELREELLRLSKAAPGFAKDNAADSAADLILQRQYFRELQSIGKLSSEESRSMAGIHAHIDKYLTRLGIEISDIEGAGKPKTVSDEDLIG